LPIIFLFQWAEPVESQTDRSNLCISVYGSNVYRILHQHMSIQHMRSW